MGDKDWGGLHCRRGRNDCRLQHANLALLVVAIAGPLTACRFSSESPQLQVLLHWIVDVLSGAEPTRAVTMERTHMWIIEVDIYHLYTWMGVGTVWRMSGMGTHVHAEACVHV